MAGSVDDLVLKIHMQHPGARPLLRQPGSSGYDISACVPVTIPPRGWSLIPTGIRMVIPKDHVGTICSRSGLAANHGVTTQAGVIDPNYRGEVKVNRLVYLNVRN